MRRILGWKARVKQFRNKFSDALVIHRQSFHFDTRGHRTGVHTDETSTPLEGPWTPLQQPYSISQHRAGHTGAACALMELFRLAPIARTEGTSILHAVAGRRRVALATSSNTLLLLAPASAASAVAPLARQLQWFADPAKGIASLAMRDDSQLLIVTHDASAFVLFLDHVMRCPPLPCGGGSLSEQPPPAAGPLLAAMSEMLAVHAVAGARSSGVSCCALCDAAGGASAAAIGTIDGAIHLIDLQRRALVCTADAEAPILRLMDLPAVPTTAALGSSAGSVDDACPAGGGGALLVRTLQGKYLLMGLASRPPTLRPLVLPPGELIAC